VQQPEVNVIRDPDTMRPDRTVPDLTV
jgi:hypothetical protein